jgi:hypothetical protein
MSVGIVFVKTFAKEPDGMFVAIFPLSFSRSGDVIVMTTICDHHSEKRVDLSFLGQLDCLILPMPDLLHI